jgi:hypothetical protein
MRKHSNAAAIALAIAAGMPALGQQTEISARPGSGIVRTRDRDSYKRQPRSRSPEQIAKHEAKMKRRHLRWAHGIADNPCLSMAQKAAIFR